MSLIPWWVKAIVIAAVVAFAVFEWNMFLSHEQEIGHKKAEAEYNADLVIKQMLAAKATQRMTKEKDNAIAQRIDAEKKAAETKRLAAVASSGLRDTIANLRKQLSGDSCETVRAYADAGLRLLGVCQERYRFVAERAKSHYADEVMFDKAWPTP